jgi:hypothetical protein
MNNFDSWQHSLDEGSALRKAYTWQESTTQKETNIYAVSGIRPQDICDQAITAYASDSADTCVIL